MKKVYRYDGKYGVLEVDLQAKKVIIDELDRHKIWADAQEDYINQQNIYSNIIEELFNDDIAEIFPPRNPNEYWCGEPTDFGFSAFNDEIEIIVDAQGAHIYERN